MAFFQNCDGVGRREVLRAGVFGATGLTLASYSQLAAASAVKNPSPAAGAAPTSKSERPVRRKGRQF